MNSFSTLLSYYGPYSTIGVGSCRLSKKERKRARGSVQRCNICGDTNSTLHKTDDGTYVCEICKDVYDENRDR